MNNVEPRPSAAGQPLRWEPVRLVVLSTGGAVRGWARFMGWLHARGRRGRFCVVQLRAIVCNERARAAETRLGREEPSARIGA